MVTEADADQSWLTRRGVRWRSTVAVVLIVWVALLVGGATLVLVLRHSLISNVNEATSQRAADIAAQVGSDDIEAARPTVNASAGDGTLVQVITGTNTVVMSSPSLDGEPPITTSRPSPGQTAGQDIAVQAADSESYRVITVGVDTPEGPAVVVAAQSLSDLAATYRTVAVLLAAGAPFLLLMVGAATWVAVGRSLAAVDTIRRRVESIESTDLHRRVPVPAADDEVGQLAVTMNAMLARLERSSATQRQFVSDASHELRSPLASLRASLDVASRRDSPEAWVDARLVLGDEVDRMTTLVDRLLTLAKADEGALTMRSVDVDVDDLVMREVRRLRSQTSLSVQIDVAPARTTGDPDRLAEAVRNLTDNAARFAQTTIRLTVTSTSDDVCVAVADDGPGIPSAEQARVAQRFVRLDDHRGRTDGGAGLGLAIVHEIVLAHGGRLEIAASQLGGASMTITLPRHATL